MPLGLTCGPLHHGLPRHHAARLQSSHRYAQDRPEARSSGAFTVRTTARYSNSLLQGRDRGDTAKVYAMFADPPRAVTAAPAPLPPLAGILAGAQRHAPSANPHQLPIERAAG